MRLFNVMAMGVAALSFGLAQGPQNQGKMAGSGMGMMRMMQDPVHASVFIAFTLPQMQTELGLSTQQAAQLREFKQELLSKGQEISRQISAKQKALAGMVSAGSSRNAEVKQLLEQMANLRAQQEFAAFDTAGKMKERLTDEQRAKLAAMQPGELRQAMMFHLTMSEMSEMMQFMGGSGGTMGRGMMGMATAPPKQ